MQNYPNSVHKERETIPAKFLADNNELKIVKTFRLYSHTSADAHGVQGVRAPLSPGKQMVFQLYLNPRLHDRHKAMALHLEFSLSSNDLCICFLKR